MDKENAITLPPLIGCDPNPQAPCLSQAAISQLGLGWEIQELGVLLTQEHREESRNSNHSGELQPLRTTRSKRL